MLGKSIALVKKTAAPAIVSAASPPKIVAEGILNLLAVPAGPAQSPDDRKRLLRLYGEAVDGFPVAVADYALQHLRFHNPRNPFPPTPQDVFEQCESTFKTWRKRVIHFFLLSDDQWGPDESDRVLAMMWGGKYRNAADYGPQPLTPGSYLPDTVVVSILRDYIKDQGVDKMDQLSEERFDGIPQDAFPPGKRDEAIATRRHKAYLDSMDSDLRRHRQRVINGYRSTGQRLPSEDKIMAEAKGECDAEEHRRIEKYGRQVYEPAPAA